MKKQLLSAVLAVVLLFSSVPSNVFAEEQYVDGPSVSATDEENQLVPEVENEKPAEGNENPIEEESGKDENSQEEVLQDEQKMEQRDLRANGVSTVEELQNAVTSAEDGDVITLADGFTFGTATLTVPDVNVTVDGKGKVWDSGAITVSGAGTGSLTIKNLKMDGSNISGRLLTNNASNGKLVLDNVELYGAIGGALDISTSGNATTEINNTHIHDNISGKGPAIFLGDGKNSAVTINYSTIENNSGNAGGWEAGAIAAKSYSGTLTINNSILRNNVNKAPYTNVFGGGGGAMSIHYFTGKININECIFEENSTNGEDGSRSSTYDGGAIYIFDGRDGAEFNIDKTTFSNNTAYDDGGAIMVQGTGNPGLTTNISNSTFYNNKAYGLDGAGYSGGAIQFFKNGGTSKMTNSILSSTFVENQSGNEQSVMEQRGGAIGGSGSSLAATFTRNDSLFIGNQVYGSNGAVNTASNYKDVSNNTVTQAGGLNVINADKGATPQYTVDDVLGIKNIMLTENQSNIKAGVNGEIVKTIPIKPEGIADNTYTGNDKPTDDQRSYVRYKDQGAVEISWVKYNANDGIFDISKLTSYDGTVYYEPNDEDKIVEYYTVGNIGGETNVVDGETTLKATLEGSEFKGWSDDKDATEANPNYAVGKELEYADENLTLYAIWGEKTPEPTEEYRVTYDGNTNDLGTVPVDRNNPYAKDSEVTVLSKGNLAKTNYTFKGWNTKADGSGTSYKAGDTFKITVNTILYAQWEKDSVDSGTGWTWSGGSSTTSKEKPKTEETLTHTAYLNGYPDNTIRPQGSITRAEVAAIFARLKVGEANIPSAKANYSDVNSSDWYTKYIAFVTDNKIMEGYEDGSFRPNDKITRAEFTAVVARYNSLADTTSTFEDVIGHWAAGYIGSVTNKGWINGYPDGTFKPEKDISREEVATMVNKMLDRKVDKDGLNNLGIKNFKDLDNSSWSYFDIVEASNSHKYVRRTLGDIMENWKELIK